MRVSVEDCVESMIWVEHGDLQPGSLHSFQHFLSESEIKRNSSAHGYLWFNRAQLLEPPTLRKNDNEINNKSCLLSTYAVPGPVLFPLCALFRFILSTTCEMVPLLSPLYR